MLIKTSGIDPLRFYDVFEILSLPVQKMPDLVLNVDARKQPELHTWTPSSSNHYALLVQPSSTPSLEISNWTKNMLLVSNDI